MKKPVMTIPFQGEDSRQIQVGDELYFGQLWDAGDAQELLEEGMIPVARNRVAEINVLEWDYEDLYKTRVRVEEIN